MVALLVALLAFVLLALVATIMRGGEQAEDVDATPAVARVERRRRFVRSYPWLPWVVGLAVAGGTFFSGLFPWVAGAIGAVAGVSVGVLLRFLSNRRLARFEAQLADSIDLMVSTLRAGGGLVDAVGSAARETPRPLRGYLRELLDRIRLGEPPEVVLMSLERRVPLESFRLYVLTLAAHWQGGGSLAATLSNVGRTIRDRVDVSRRIRSQSVETQVSVVGVLVVTYGLALLMWRNYPERFETFATSELGSMFIGLSIGLQGIGMFWISRMTRIEV